MVKLSHSENKIKGNRGMCVANLSLAVSLANGDGAFQNLIYG